MFFIKMGKTKCKKSEMRIFNEAIDMLRESGMIYEQKKGYKGYSAQVCHSLRNRRRCYGCYLVALFCSVPFFCKRKEYN